MPLSRRVRLLRAWLSYEAIGPGGTKTEFNGDYSLKAHSITGKLAQSRDSIYTSELRYSVIGGPSYIKVTGYISKFEM